MASLILDINECEGVTCENGGQCIDQINSYSCECADGFEGDHCETSENFCIFRLMFTYQVLLLQGSFY